MQSDHFQVVTEDSILKAHAVILNAPLGCLQRNTISFDPCLPARIQSAITTLGFGNLEKLFLKFERAWWHEGHECDKPSPEIYTFLPPITLPPQAPERLLTMFSLAGLPVHPQPLLAVYLAGSWTTYLASLPDSAIKDLFETHYLPKLPNYSRDHAIVDIVRTNWSEDPWTYGSYTHIPVGAENGYESLKYLGERIMGPENGVGGLWFAGEHAGTGDIGTVNGAMMSGRSAALQVLKALGENIDDLQ
jgi:monoamine oxidase